MMTGCNYNDNIDINSRHSNGHDHMRNAQLAAGFVNFALVDGGAIAVIVECRGSESQEDTLRPFGLYPVGITMRRYTAGAVATSLAQSWLCHAF
eukprot:4424390-Amphidinium_carterae.2